MPYNTKEKYLAYYTKKKAEREKNKPKKVCPMCANTFEYKKGRSKGEACDTCYKKYRSLYNLLHSAKYRATKEGLEFDLDIQWMIEQPEYCKFTGAKLSYKENGTDYSNRNPFAASVDKINPTKGYTKDNCQIVCWWFNCAKQRYSVEEVVSLCRLVVNTCDTSLAQNAEKEVLTGEETT